MYIYIYIYLLHNKNIYIDKKHVNLPGAVDFSLSNGAQLAAQAFCQTCRTCNRW